MIPPLRTTRRRRLAGVLPATVVGLALAVPAQRVAAQASEPAAAAPAAAGDVRVVAEGAAATDGGDAPPSEAPVAGGDGHECAAGDDFPTTAVADYVLGCMAANGNSYEALQQCSCSIDFIKARMDYTAYEQASTILQVQRDIGQRGIFYRDSNWAKRRIERLEALQAESTLRCF